MYKSYIYTTFYKFVHKPGLFCFSFSFLSRDKYSTNLTIYEKAKMVCFGLETGVTGW